LKNLKRNAVVAAVLLFVCAAAYLNWSYNSKWDDSSNAMAQAEDAAMAEALGNTANGTQEEAEEPVSEYFAKARLTRQQSRDEALKLLETAAASENASQETIDSAMDAISAMATCELREAQIENLLIAKDFADCVVFMADDGITVAVPAPVEGLSVTAVAKITDTVISETGREASQIKVIEVKG